jgi:ubiquinone/menaquinone biosynthesis C-methylase UbiE
VFDAYASRYSEAVNSSIRASGETVDYFAEVKAARVRQGTKDQVVRTLLDFGCGTGSSTRALRRAMPRATSVVGADPSRSSIDVARRLSAEEEAIEYRESSASGLPFPDGAFDVVSTACVFHHIERGEHSRWLHEIRRVLAPGGSFFLFEHNPYNPLTRRVVRQCPFDEGVVLLRPSYARAALRAAGFRPGSAEYYFFFPSWVRWLRRLEPALSRVPVGAQYVVRATG